MNELDWAHARPAHPDELGLTRRAQITGMFSAFVAVAAGGRGCGRAASPPDGCTRLDRSPE